MDELLTVFLNLPAITAVVGATYIALRCSKTGTVRVLLALAIVSIVFFFLDAQSTDPHSRLWIETVAFVIEPFAFPSVLAFMICFIWKVYYEKHLPWYQYLWFIAPVSICSISLMLAYVIGFDELMRYNDLYDHFRHYPDQYINKPLFRLAYWVQQGGFKYVSLVYGSWVVIFSARALNKSGFTLRALHGFFFQKASLPPMHLVLLSFSFMMINSLARVALGRFFLFDYPFFNVFFAVNRALGILMLIFSTISLEYVECTLRQTFMLDSNEDQSAVDKFDEIDEIDDEDKEDAKSAPAMDSELARQLEERLDAGLNKLMTEERLFLDCDLRMSVVARKLGTNRSYLSRHVNEKYGVNFNEYINKMRIEFSKQYMLENPNLLLDNIAIECGFSTAQSFGRRFKIMEGVTPRTWLFEKQKELRLKV